MLAPKKNGNLAFRAQVQALCPIEEPRAGPGSASPRACGPPPPALPSAGRSARARAPRGPLPLVISRRGDSGLDPACFHSIPFCSEKICQKLSEKTPLPNLGKAWQLHVHSKVGSHDPKNAVLLPASSRARTCMPQNMLRLQRWYACGLTPSVRLRSNFSLAFSEPSPQSPFPNSGKSPPVLGFFVLGLSRSPTPLGSTRSAGRASI